MAQAALIINAGSRSGAALEEQACRELESHGLTLGMSADVPGAEIPHWIRQALDGGLSPIVVGGGDGTQAIAADALKNTGVPLGILPLGTGNALARDLRIPLDLAGACRTVATGHPLAIDIGEANGRVFVNLCSLGLVAGIDEALNPAVKSIVGRAAYVSAVAVALSQRVPFELTMEFEGHRETVTTLLGGCGPGNTQGGILPLPGPTSHLSGELSCYAVDSLDLVKYAELLWRLRTGTEEEMPELRVQSCAEFLVETSPVQSAVLDGELVAENPLHLRCLPRALTVIVPA